MDRTFSIVTRVQTLCDQPLLKKANAGYQVRTPFNWNIINTAAVLARAVDDNPEAEAVDQIKVKLASLRHFNRLCNISSIGIGEISNCLKLDAEIPTEAITKAARDQLIREQQKKRTLPAEQRARFIELRDAKLATATAVLAKNTRLSDQVYMLCNSSDVYLNYIGANNSEPGVFADEEVCDYDQYGYIAEGILDKCVDPVRTLLDFCLTLEVSNFRSEVLSKVFAYKAELKQLGDDLGIKWDKIAAENAAIAADMAILDASLKIDEGSIDDMIASIPEADTQLDTTEHREFKVIKSAERIARETEEARVAAVNETLKEKAAVAKAKRSAKKVKSLAELNTL